MINISYVLSETGAVKKEKLPFNVDKVEVNGISYPIVSKSEIELTMTNQGKEREQKEEIQVEYHVELSVDIPCDRCLKSVIKQFDLSYDDRISFLDDAENEDIKSGYVVGYNLDVDKLVYDEILVNWPSKILCSDDCKGVCGSCGKNLNLGTCDCQDTGLDLRMAVIQDIFKEFKEV